MKFSAKFTSVFTATFSAKCLLIVTGFFVYQTSMAASVKSISRAVSVDVAGAQVQQRTVSCSDQQQRVITKAQESRQWCFGDDTALCHRDIVNAAKKACRANTNANVAKASSAAKDDTNEATSDESVAKASEDQVMRQNLSVELQQIELDRQKVKVRLEGLERQREQLLDRRSTL